MLKTRLFTAIALIAALLLLAPAAYADEKTTTGSFTASSSAPTVDAIDIYTNIGCTIPAASMDPLTTYYAKATVTSKSKLKHLATVKVTVFYDATGADPVAPVAGNTQTCAILTCTVGPPASWAIDSGGPPTTWQIVGGSCSQPANLELTTGDWIFAFMPGKVATESIAPANWDAQGLATNKSSQSGELYVLDKDMNWYGEVTVSTGSVDWGTVPLGLLFGDAENPETGITTNYIANGDYEEDIKSTSWTGAVTLDTVTLDETGGNPPAADSQFALKGNDINELASAVTVQTTYNSIDDSGDITPEGGDDVATNTLWLSLSAAGIAPDTYSGSIYYQIANR